MNFKKFFSLMLLSGWFAVGTKISTWWNFFGLCEFLWNSWNSQKSEFKKSFPPSSCWTLLSVWFAIGTKILSWWKIFWTLWILVNFLKFPKLSILKKKFSSLILVFSKRWWQLVSKWWVQFLHHLLVKIKNWMWVVDG